jgi:hypothetical protein
MKVYIEKNIDNQGIVDLIPLDKATKQEQNYASRVIVNNKGEIVKRISEEDLIRLDCAIAVGDQSWRK